MPIEGFNYQEFSKLLSKEASQVLPVEFSAEDKQYISGTVYNFCFIAGEALFNDTSVTLNSQQASIITQFIGEWTFHKAIDLIKGGVPHQFRDGIMQKVAFTVFEIAKQATIQNLEQAQMIQVVEHHVKKVFSEALEELEKSGAMSHELVASVSSRSNIDDMAQEMKSDVATTSDSKILKLATLAMVMRNMSQQKITQILQKFDPQDAQILIEYIQMQDLENKLDQSITQKCLKEMKMSLPEPKKLNIDKVYSKLFKVVKGSEPQKIADAINTERSNVRNFVFSVYDDKKEKMPARVADIICQHIEQKAKASTALDELFD